MNEPPVCEIVKKCKVASYVERFIQVHKKKRINCCSLLRSPHQNKHTQFFSELKRYYQTPQVDSREINGCKIYKTDHVYIIFAKIIKYKAPAYTQYP